jgi:2,7-dihydroxy-5-methyl-1-naphthoate 7-O-methyltransferase
MPDIWTLADLATPWCLHVVVTLRVAQRIAAGTDHVDDLAAAAGADRDSLHRVLRHLVGRGVFEEPSPGTFALNDAARQLLDEGLVIGFDLDGFGGRMAHAWSTMLSAVRTGRPAYREVFGRDYWDDLHAHPEIAAQFDALMGPAGHGTPDPDVLLSGWDGVGTVVDVGGGTGALLIEILRAHPAVHGTLVDLPGTVARAAPRFGLAGVADRVTLAPQSFFDPLPAGADVYVMKNVLSDWSDTEATALLARCADAARPRGRVVMASGVSPDSDRGPAPELLMMVLVGGRGRTLSEFRSLAREAGLEVTTAGNNRAGRFIVECTAAGGVTQSTP